MISEAAAPAQVNVPAATMIISDVAHVSAKPFRGDAEISLSYEPSKLPQNIDVNSDLFILSYSDAVGLWLPVDSVVNAINHTITVATKHFSDWVVA